MSITEWVMTNWELISLLINGILTVLILRQRDRMKATETAAITASAEAERVKSQAIGDLEEVRNQGAQNLAMLRVLEGTLSNMARLAAGIEEGNAIRRIEASNVSSAVAGMADSHKQVTALINEFQIFSKTQHDSTRRTVTDVGGKVDMVIANVQEARNDLAAFKRDLNGRFQRLEPSLKNRFESSERKLDEALKDLPDTDKLNPADVPDRDPADPTPPADPPSADAA
jgi:HAMP domain-containing protein